ncbi:hypothetical protein FA15DRAFT_702467 [Coprinopsis marcescibilis]|uniref:Uncharacterized protein n=1 Tax=Coprinopsis marcescibilis TaxID=230819 RepID=A0A5C3L252_COPMA|nr:hypothetical protein FA15DRAFT_702467 [Coprinopsis marcescibilis]
MSLGGPDSSTKLDKVDRTLSTKQTIILTDLVMFATTNAVPGFDNEPSSSAVAFLEILEDADPNLDAFDPHDDNNNNAGWGHYQYTGRGKNMRNSFPAWGDSYTVDMYLAILIEHLWDIAPTLFKPQISNPRGDNSKSGVSGSQGGSDADLVIAD